MDKSLSQNVELEIARKRAKYRAWHRGTKELDFILGKFCDTHINNFDQEQLSRFEKLMDHEETDLQAWLMGLDAIPSGDEGDLLRRIRKFHLGLMVKSGGAN